MKHIIYIGLFGLALLCGACGGGSDTPGGQSDEPSWSSLINVSSDTWTVSGTYANMESTLKSMLDMQNSARRITLVLNDITSISANSFAGCKTLYGIKAGKAKSIGAYAFSGCTNLKSVSFAAAETVDDNAFDGCTALTDVSLPVAVTVETDAFSNCTALTELSLPLATTARSFKGCTALKKLNLPKAVAIHCYDCTSLEDIYVPEVAKLYEQCFYRCTSLATLSLPKVTELYPRAFVGCYGLTSLSFGSEITFIDRGQKTDSGGYYNDPFNTVSTTYVDLTLNPAQKNSANYPSDATEKTFADHTWKSISYSN